MIGGRLFWLIRSGDIAQEGMGWGLIGAAVTTALATIWFSARSVNFENTAQKLESHFPTLNATLLTALEQDAAHGQLSFLQQQVIREAVYHSYQHSWPRLVSGWKLMASPLVATIGLATLLATSLAIALFAAPVFNPNEVPFDSAVVQLPLDFELKIEPGNAEVEKGTNLLVLARFGTSLPANADLVFKTISGDEQRISMQKSLDDPVFGARIVGLAENLTYRVSYGEKDSSSFQVSVFEFPALVRNDVDVVFPEYTKLPAKSMIDVRRITAVEGSTAHLRLELNKSVATATLTTKSGESLTLAADPKHANVYRTSVPMSKIGSTRYALQLVDPEQRTNPTTTELVFNVVPNRKPDLKLQRPARDLQISAVEELDLKANVWDDFGIQKMGVSVRLGDEVSELILGETVPARERKNLETILEMEALRAEVDQLLSYYFWAEDFGPDGKTRRISSDMYFAEIRPFDEIYRQGQSPGGQPGAPSGGGNSPLGQAAQQLADLQKEIVNAAWKIVRRETRLPVTEQFADDVELLALSQRAALALLEQAAEAIEDAASNEDLAEARQFMNAAVKAFEKAAKTDSPQPVAQGQREAQFAMQALLKLKAKEHQIAQMKRQPPMAGGQSANSRQQRQLNQMELKEQDDRYEQERTAAPTETETAEQRENRQTLRRLKELARRQNDLNDRIKELQSAMEEAETDKEKAELERELKRLRDEQKSIADNLEQLQEKMENSTNPQSMSEPAKQVEQARQNAQRASEALQQQELSQAAAEGRRAENELDDLRDEFQNRTSGQFVQQLQEMRNEAQDLEIDEQEIANALDELEPDRASDSRPQLRDENNRDDLEQQLIEQAKRIDELKTDMKRTIEEAEEFEPLLAEELYETYRDTERKRPGQALESASRSIGNGFTLDAIEEETRGRKGIEQLRKGIEKAAESILGDESAALDAARNRLEKLNRELNNEISKNIPEQRANGDNNSERQSEKGQGSENNAGDQPGTPSQQQPGRNPGAPDPNQSGGGNQNDGPPNQANGQGPDQHRLSPLDSSPESGDPNLNDRDAAPLTGQDFLDWADRLRDVESMVPVPELRAEAARLREKAKEIRKDFKRHSKDPNWPIVQKQLAEPLAELQKRVTEELIRRSTKNARVPLERDSVPARYRSTVEKYFEKLGN